MKSSDRFSKSVSMLAGIAVLSLSLSVSAKLTDDEMATLGVEGTPLIPMGGLRAGNEAGTIPPWTGGIKEPPPNFVTGGTWVDPFPDDERLFTITAENYRQYEDHLTAAAGCRSAMGKVPYMKDLAGIDRT